jgi:hypothetical protein
MSRAYGSAHGKGRQIKICMGRYRIRQRYGGVGDKHSGYLPCMFYPRRNFAAVVAALLSFKKLFVISEGDVAQIIMIHDISRVHKVKRYCAVCIVS